MKFTLDQSTGSVVVDPIRFGDGSETPETLLCVPTVAMWCAALDAQATTNQADFDAVARLTVGVLRRLGHQGPPSPGVWPLWVCDADVLAQLLVHWRDWPVSAFTTPAADAPARPDRHPNLSPGRRVQVDLYQACRPYVTPAEVDAMAMWQVAALLIDHDTDDKPESPDVETHGYFRRETYVDGFGKRHIRKVAWSRNPDAPLRYAGARPQPMPAPRTDTTAAERSRLRPEIM